jgi:hypothetical protein
MRAEAELAMTALLDEPLVRRALADALGGGGDALRRLILALASDQPDAVLQPASADRRRPSQLGGDWGRRRPVRDREGPTFRRAQPRR